MSSTFFSASPDWRWLIIGYFFFGGLAGGSYFLATILDIFGRDRRLVRLGYLVAFPIVAICGLLLTIDLGRPERFWHMLVQSGTWRPMLKPYSPMSLGAWALLCFGVCALLSFLAALGEGGVLRWSLLRRVNVATALSRAITVTGSVLGLYVAGYTGVLLAVTNRPIWSDTTWLGLTFLLSAGSTSAAALLLLGACTGVSRESADVLERFDGRVVGLELLAIVGLVASLQNIAPSWLHRGGIILFAVILASIALRLILQWRRPRRAFVGPTLVLLGGLFLRALVVFASEGL
jgi:formate-dependent nitrite reductase membrane component NrfD